MEKSIDGRITPTLNGFKEYENGGKGSGNFGHVGRPGEVGGSAARGSGSAKTAKSAETKTQLSSGDQKRLSMGIDENWQDLSVEQLKQFLEDEKISQRKQEDDIEEYLDDEEKGIDQPSWISLDDMNTALDDTKDMIRILETRIKELE